MENASKREINRSNRGQFRYGKSIVERFVKEGALVVAVARRKERLDALKESLAQEKGQVLVFQGDVSKKEDNEKIDRTGRSTFWKAGCFGQQCRHHG